MNPSCYIEIPGDKLREAVAAAYDLSRPQGLGMIHYQPGSLSEDEISGILDRNAGGVSLDYVKGRACKFHAYTDDGKLYVSPHWYDHGRDDLTELLTRLGVDDPSGKIDAALTAQQAARAAA